MRHLIQFDADSLGVDRVSFWSLGDETTTIHCDAGYIASSNSFERGATLFEVDHPAYFDALRAARILSIDDVVGDSRTRGLQDYCAARKIASMLNVPVWVDGRLAGVLCHEHVGARRHWRAAEEDFARGAGQIVASALVARAQTSAEAAARRAAFLDSVSRLILASLDAREIAKRVVDLIVPRFADFAMVWSQNDAEVLEPLASTHVVPGMRPLVVDAARAAVVGSSSPGLAYVVAQGQSLLYPDVSPFVLERLGEAQRERALLAGVRTLLVVPLVLAGRTLGAMTWGAANRHYRSEDLALAEAVAERVAGALENARLYEIAQQAIRARDEFLILAAHEFRTPLTALQLFAYDPRVVSSRGGARPPGATDESLRSANLARQVRRLSTLVERVCDAARIRTEGIALTLAACDLTAIVTDRGDVTAERARRSGCELVLRAQSSVVGRWDRARLGQLVDELLDNAIKFGVGKPIEVTLDRDGDSARLIVRDRGAGIPTDRLTSIFSPFERAVPRDHCGGLGLGLHVAKAIVEAHGGSIEVTSHLERGTTVTARLPIDDSWVPG
jgi:signal transduction histidine kinase